VVVVVVGGGGVGVGVAVTGLVAADVARSDPCLVVAETTTLRVDPTSTVVGM
jgi:hypothetical protein